MSRGVFFKKNVLLLIVYHCLREFFPATFSVCIAASFHFYCYVVLYCYATLCFICLYGLLVAFMMILSGLLIFIEMYYFLYVVLIVNMVPQVLMLAFSNGFCDYLY